AARGFMKLLMPSHVRRVMLHAETTPLFQRYGAEDQLSAMYQPLVQLKSGGYLVINPTEALVSIDINSGRSTREHNIEQTAYNTNLEAAQEIARQLRLRDMAGLIVIDFIDMEQSSHVRKVEKAMKEALRNDRARIQVGRISSFGLMEMSRQRLRTGVLEASTKPCAHCEGTGLMRTAASAGLSALRMIEDEATRGRGDKIQLRAGREAAVYVLNKKRFELADIEQRYGVSIEIVIDESLEGARMSVESSGARPVAAPRPVTPPVEEADEPELADESFEDDDQEDEEERDEKEAGRERSGQSEASADEDRPGRRRRRRRRGGRGRRREGVEGDSAPAPEQAVDSESEAAPEAREAAEPQPEEGAAPKGRRRRRGRKPGLSEAEGAPLTESADAGVAPDSSPMVETPIDQEQPISETEAVAEAKPKRRRSKKADAAEVPISEPAPAEAPPAATADEDAPPAKPTRKRRSKAAIEAEADAPEPVTVPAANNDTADDEDSADGRRGWWQRTFGAGQPG
ncbi:MAG: ribonuclease E/G, partial [Sphingomicrobium sp.]